MELFERTGAYLRGHFRLTSGLHSGEYLQCAKVLAYPAFAEELGRGLADKLRAVVNGNVDVVLAPALGGLIIGLIETFWSAYAPSGPEYKDVAAFSMLAIVLIFFPSGL